MKIAMEVEWWKIYYYQPKVAIIESPEWEQQEIKWDVFMEKYRDDTRKYCKSRLEAKEFYINKLPKEIPYKIRSFFVHGYITQFPV